MKYDLEIDYKELMDDKIVNIKIENCGAALWQYSLVNILITVANIVSPVKFNIYFQ